MSQVLTVGFSGQLIPSRGCGYSVWCQACRTRVLQGSGSVYLNDIRHVCGGRSPNQAEYEILFDETTGEDEDLALPFALDRRVN